MVLVELVIKDDGRALLKAACHERVKPLHSLGRHGIDPVLKDRATGADAISEFRVASQKYC